MPTLYELTDNYKNIAAMLDDPDMDQAVITTALATVEEDLQAKTGNVAVIMQSMATDIDIIKAEERRLAERRRTIEARRDWLKNYLQENLERMGLDKISTPLFKISLAKNPPAVSITDEKAIPAAYLTIVPQTTVVDKKAIAAALKEGKEVPGATLTVGRSVRIR